MKLPSKIFGIDTSEAYQRYLEGSKSAPKPQPSKPLIVPATNLVNPENYIILEGRKHGSYEYPDLLLPSQRNHFNEDWNQSHESLKTENSYMITIRQFVDFLNLLKSGEVYNGAGRKIDSRNVNKVLDEILTLKDPWRAEWLDARFTKKQGNEMYVNYHKINNNGIIEEVTEPLEECLMKDRAPGMNLDDWLKNANNQGLPKKDVAEGDLYYWNPRKDRVAWFGASSVGADLVCGRDPADSDAGLGVRGAKIKR